jgi:large repetitive protein
MREPVTFETRLATAFERYAEGAPVDVEPVEMARLAMYGDTRPRAAIRWLDLRTPAWRYAAVLALLLLALVAAVIVGSALIRDDDLPIVHGEFIRTGPLTADGTRQAVLLANGRVLLVGSRTQPNSGDDVGIAEVLDPATGEVARLDEGPSPRNWTLAGMVRLADDSVLVVGGEQFDTQGQRPAPAEVIDPAGGSVTTVGPMVHPRYGHTATLLDDGRVLIAGGDVSIGGSPNADPPAELFDPASGSFRDIGPLQYARLYHQATVLEDGKVLLTGGYGPGDVTTAEVFDPASELFAVVGALHHGRVDHSATLLENGRVLLAGGNGIEESGLISDAALASAELFDPATGKFNETGPLTTERSQHGAVLLPDSRVLIAGGFNEDGEPRTTELYDPATGSFVRGADALDRLGGTSAVVLPDGRALVLGEDDQPELFEPSTVGRTASEPTPVGTPLAGKLSAVDPPAQERYAHTATLLPDGRVLVVGGRGNDAASFDTAELYDPATGNWSNAGRLNEARSFHTAALLADGRVLVTGGQVPVPNPDGTIQDEAIDSAEVYDPSTGQFTLIGRMSVARGSENRCCSQVRRHTATLLGDGRVLVSSGFEPAPLDLFDPASNAFTNVQTPCSGEPVMLTDGRVLFGCGFGIVFDPATNQVTAEADSGWLNSLRTRLPDGRILVTGAVGSSPLVAEALGDAWWTLETLLEQTGHPAAALQTTTPLPDGRTLVFGRLFNEQDPLKAGFAAVFDPRLATFTEVLSPAGRFAPTATMLLDGRILFLGIPNRSPDRTDPEPPVAELLDLGLPR